MSKHRRPEIRFPDAPRGTCRWCGEAILHGPGEKCGEPNRRRRWHPECVEIYNASDPREARRRIRKRDRGRCAACRVDTYRVRRELTKIGRGRARAIRARGYKPGQSFWELDHVVPLIDGGSHDDDNLQTLCTPCHTAKTANEARARADRARVTLPAIAQPAADDSFASNVAPPAEAPAPSPPTRPRTLDELFEAVDAVNARVQRALDIRDADSSPSS